MARRHRIPDIVYHSTNAEFSRFEEVEGADAGFHFGTLEQARMRGGKRMLACAINVTNPARLIDKGSWSRRDLKSLSRRGHDSVVYLNRYEGIGLAAFERLGGCDETEMPDRKFKNIIPESQDSWIVFDPSDIRILSVA